MYLRVKHSIIFLMNIISINAKDYEEKYHIHSLLAKLLKVSELDDSFILELLKEGYELSTSSDECVKAASKRILEAKDNNEKIFVVGDYDADGICAASIMKILLDKLGIENDYYIPNRFTDGYGLNEDIVLKAKDNNSDLIITVDNGVKALDAINKAKELGIDIIITDHHTIEEELKDVLVVHPDYMSDEYKYLCGAAVALEISRYLIGDDEISTALAAVASIADVMVLSKETREIVKAGLEIIKKKIPYSIYALNNGGEIDYETIGFQIAPKLNCVGRLADKADVNVMPEYLISDSHIYIDDISREINNFNDQRKELQRTQVTKAKELMNDDPFIIVADESFHEGVNGIVAGRLTEEFNRPSLVMSIKDGVYKGSARSPEGINLIELFKDNEYVKGGGHKSAAGYSVKKEDFKAFYDKCQNDTKELLDKVVVREKEYIALDLNDLTVQNFKELSRIEPKPKQLANIKFAISAQKVSRIFNNENVVKFMVGTNSEAVLFKNSEYYKNNGFNGLKDNEYLLGRLTLNEYKGNIKVQMIVEGIGE